ncbi:flagellar hook-length control protein [Methylibium petroleiphilum]|uniref:Putative flagellar hook-length control protein n=1 Tax=Methylibium petroleiphilum (strain ATCC BAA-1232 / LMG 22953 / PM1) TaxID=420662 RepID=A2SNF6_METPP|nr:flagellar hook-length control protein [Methylibium petroleiphilum]ABM97095.1 putative flagellar hook-length control protein [Methylibium petroleiphilum PM1]
MIRLILLGAAVLAGGVLLKAAHDKPGPLTIDSAAQAVRPGAQAATRAVDSAGELAGTISKAADSGWTAAKDTAGMLGDAVDAGSKLIGVTTPKLGEILPKRQEPAAARTEAAPAASRVDRHAPSPVPPAAPAVYRAPATRSGAMAVLPLEQASPDAASDDAQGDR